MFDLNINEKRFLRILCAFHCVSTYIHSETHTLTRITLVKVHLNSSTCFLIPKIVLFQELKDVRQQFLAHFHYLRLPSRFWGGSNTEHRKSGTAGAKGGSYKNFVEVIVTEQSERSKPHFSLTCYSFPV